MRRSAAAALGALALVACSSGRHVGPKPDDGPLAIWPAAASLAPGDALAFAANRAVTWTLDESGAGALDAGGRYVAPAGAGEFHVRATDDRGQVAVAAVSVAPRALQLLAGLPGGPGSVDGVGAAAHFIAPNSLAADGLGHLFVADNSTHTVRRIELATRSIATIAGQPGLAGIQDGVATAALFRSPSGVAADASGFVYVADTDNACVRRVDTASDIVITLAGRPLPHQEGADDGIGDAATFTIPTGVALDGKGRLFVADPENNAVRALDLASHAVTTFAGAPGPGAHVDAVGTAARFRFPLYLAFDGAHTLFVADRNNQALRTIDVDTAAVGTLAALGDFPTGMAASGATVYVAFASNVAAFDAASGARTAIAGSLTASGFADGTGAAALFDHASGLALDGATLYVADRSNHVIRAIDLPTGAVTTVLGARSPGSADGAGAQARFDVPTGVAADDAGVLYVADTFNHTIREVHADGSVLTLAGTAGLAGNSDGIGAEARFNHPSGLASDGLHLYVADSDNALLRRVDLADVENLSRRGQVITFAGGASGGADGRGTAAGFVDPVGVAWDGAGHVYVADLGSSTVRAIDLESAEVSTLAGSPGVAGGSDGVGADARFDGPVGIAADRLGNLYVADAYGRVIRRVSIDDASVTTFVGEPGAIGRADGAGALARLASPGALACDGAGNLWIADALNHALRRVVARDVTTPVGRSAAGAFGVELGPLPAQLGSPTGVALLPSGELAILDENALLVVR
ncbi:MAG TPA: hypothetical protein VFF06_34740 [Polyangia bacterium]|nr:hypothetical protein [Polyangia bacterium]